MTFAQPLWLIAGLAVCIALLLLIRALQERRWSALEKFAAHQLLGRLTRNISNRKRRIKNILIIAAVFMCFAALARPQYGFKWVEVKRKGIDILFALDTSKSMLAEDIKPNRLERAHYAILDFVRQLEGDRVGLMPFAGSAFLMCPLTLDYNAFEHSLSAVTVDIIPQGGTDIAAVINTAATTLNNAANHKILILITDGENLQGDAVQAAKEGAAKGLTIYTVGVGTREGELIPLTGGGFVKDKQGKFITSRLDEPSLKQIAEKSGGLYVPLGNSGEGLETVYREKLALIPKEEIAERRQKIPLERFEYPLALAIILLISDFLLGERKSRKSLSLPPIKSVSRRMRRNGGLLLLVLLLTTAGTKAHSSEGEDAYNRGDYIAASEYYSQRLLKSPDDPELHYNFGAAAYKNNMFDDAIASFSKALESNNIDLQKKAYYNRGNSYYRKGLDTVQGDPESTIQQWQKALESLQSVMELSPDDKDAANNHDLIKKQLEELQKKQEQDKEQQKKNKDQQKEQKEQKKNGQEKDSGQNQSAGENEKSSQKDTGQAAEKEQNSMNKPSETDQKKMEEKSREEQAAIDAQRQQQGKMTKEEAERLLNGLKSEEGELNFVPQDRGAETNSNMRDW